MAPVEGSATQGGSTGGVVVEFDDPRGIGIVRSDGGVDHFFHCTAIADGSRTIEVGARVTFEVVAGRRGRWEATRLTPRG